MPKKKPKVPTGFEREFVELLDVTFPLCVVPREEQRRQCPFQQSRAWLASTSWRRGHVGAG